MRLIGYGEDGLTAWAFDRHLQRVLRLLEDNSPADECLVFYRPSCGRGGGTQFGEFDAILASKKAVYLFENKWDGSAIQIVEGRIVLKECQIHRHSTFQLMRTLWQQHHPGSWQEFAGHWQAEGCGGELPLPRTRLARNIAALMNALQEYPNEMKNVLLYFHGQHMPNLNGVEPPVQFMLRQLPYPNMGDSLFFDFDATPPDL